MYVFDTDAVSAILRGRLPPASRRRLAGLARSERGTTAITVGELRYGVARIGLPERPTAAIEAFVDAVEVLPFGREVANRYGELRAHLERRGTRLDDADLQIAATCLVRGATLVTGNVKHFARVKGLHIENWLVGASA